MSKYTGNTCPVCEEKFKDSDDVVVCPDCGTPYHRECWHKIGACIHKSEHAAGFEWKPDKVEDGGLEDLVCTNCGTHNPLNAQRCSHCGVPLPDPRHDLTPKEGERPIYAGGSSNSTSTSWDANMPSGGPQFTSTANFERRTLGPEDTIDGVKAKDWASYIGRSSFYYLMQFFRMQETHRKAFVSFSAFLFGPIYFFYRKMWKQGAIFSVITLLLTIPSALYMLALSESSLVAGWSFAWLPMVSNVCYVLDWAQMVLRGFMAVYWYKKESAARIHDIYAAVPEGPARADALAMRGGTSVLAVCLYLLVYMLGCAVLVALMGPNLSAVLSLVSL